jgi:anti-sigma B factor antagonist
MNLSVVVSGAGAEHQVGVLRLAGELDIATSGTLRQSLAALSDEGYRNVVLDMGGVTFCDSTGLGTIATFARRLIQAGDTLVVLALRPDVAAVFRLAGLTAVLPVADTMEGALELANA